MDENDGGDSEEQKWRTPTAAKPYQEDNNNDKTCKRKRDKTHMPHLNFPNV